MAAYELTLVGTVTSERNLTSPGRPWKREVLDHSSQPHDQQLEQRSHASQDGVQDSKWQHQWQMDCIPNMFRCFQPPRGGRGGDMHIFTNEQLW